MNVAISPIATQSRIIGWHSRWQYAAVCARLRERAANQKRQTVMIVTCAAGDREYLQIRQIKPSRVLSVEGDMIDALLNVAVFAALALCIVGFSAWAHKRIDAH